MLRSFFIQSEGLVCNLTAGEYGIAVGVWNHASACIYILGDPKTKDQITNTCSAAHVEKTAANIFLYSSKLYTFLVDIIIDGTPKIESR